MKKSKRKSSRLRTCSETSWPDPRDLNEVQHTLIHGKPTREDILHAASVMQAYSYLCLNTKTLASQNLSKIKKAIEENNTI
jgi:hypothetical protein